MKSKTTVIIILSCVLVVLGVITLFAFKVKGSNGTDFISECVPYNVVITKGDEYEAIIEWKTEENCLGYVSYGSDRENLDFLSLDVDNLSSKEHIVVIDKLLPSQTYFFIINSGEGTYGNKGLPLSFSLSSL
jgi:hypothetical protein